MEEQKILLKPNKYIESKVHEGGGYKGGKMTKYYLNFESALGSYKGLNGNHIKQHLPPQEPHHHYIDISLQCRGILHDFHHLCLLQISAQMIQFYHQCH